MSDQQFFPDGYVAGCLPRATKFGTVCAAFSDKIKVLDDDVCRDLIGKTGLLKHINVVFDQGRDGSCATESTTSTVHLIREANNAPFIQLNPLSIYAFTRAAGGGSNIDRNLERARDVGILPEDVWPRSRGSRTRPPQTLLDLHAVKHRIDEFYDIETIPEIRTSLCLDFPVVFGWRRHSCVLVKARDMDSAYYLNSWGARWSETEWPGIGIIRYRDIERGYGMFAVRTVTDAGIVVPDTSLVNAG